MIKASRKPILFLVFANDRQQGGAYLHDLGQEAKQLRTVLADAAPAHLYPVAIRTNVSAIEDKIATDFARYFSTALAGSDNTRTSFDKGQALPPIDLPPKPFRDHSCFHRADASIFFGRGHQIREFYTVAPNLLLVIDQLEELVIHDAPVRAWDRLLHWKQQADEYLPLQRRLTQ